MEKVNDGVFIQVSIGGKVFAGTLNEVKEAAAVTATPETFTWDKNAYDDGSKWGI